MIYLIDDTLEIQLSKKIIGETFKGDFQSILKVYEKPKISDLKYIVENLEGLKLICYHKSFRLFNSEGNLVFGSDFKRNFLNRLQEMNIPKVEFSGDVHTNFGSKTIDKTLFYNNFEYFLNNIKITGDFSFEKLFYGKSSNHIRKLEAASKIIDYITFDGVDSLKNNSEVLSLFEIVFPKLDPIETIKKWENGNFSKNEIYKAINQALK